MNDKYVVLKCIEPNDCALFDNDCLFQYMDNRKTYDKYYGKLLKDEYIFVNENDISLNYIKIYDNKKHNEDKTRKIILKSLKKLKISKDEAFKNKTNFDQFCKLIANDLYV